MRAVEMRRRLMADTMPGGCAQAIPNMDLKQSSVVVVGALNPAIVEPVWLIENKIVATPPQDAPIPMMQSPGRIEFEIEGFHWAVDRMRLTIQSDTERSPAAVVKKLFSELKHTPVRAIGHNFHFRSGLSDWRGGRPELAGCVGFKPEGCQEQIASRWLGAWKREGSVVQVDVEMSDQAALVRVNVERSVVRAAEVVDYAESFTEDLATARGIAASLEKGMK